MFFLIALRSLKNQTLLSDPAVVYYVLYNNSFYTLLAFVFDLQKDFFIVHDNTDAFFLFLLQKTVF